MQGIMHRGNPQVNSQQNTGPTKLSGRKIDIRI